MKRFRKSLAGSLAAMLLFMSAAPSGAAASPKADSALPKFSFLKDAGIFSGFDDGSAHLDDPMTREQFAVVLSKLWGLKLPASPPALYSDIEPGRWSAAAIAAVTQAGFMNGTADGVFAPEQQVTLEQLAVILVRAFGIGTGGLVREPALGRTDAWAKPYVIQAISHGLITPEVDFTGSAARADLVESAYISYQQLLAKGITTLPGIGVALTAAEATDAHTIEATFSDGGRQSATYAPGLEPGKPTAVQVMYKGNIYTASVTLSPSPSPSSSSSSSSSPSRSPSPSSSPSRSPSPSSSPSRSPSPSPSPSPSSSPSPSTTTAVDDWPVLSAAAAIGNTKVKISFAAAAASGPGTAGDYRITDNNGNSLPVHAVRAGVGGVYAVLDTDPQIAGQDYSVSFGGRVLPFAGAAADYLRPQLLSAVVQPDASITLTFSEPLDPATVMPTDNYSIAGLTVKEADLGDDGSTVTLYTSLQQEAFPYYLNVFRVTDWTGNAVLPGRPMLVRGKADLVKPTFVVAINQGDTTVDARFSKKLDRTSAETTSHYAIAAAGDGPGLTVRAAKLLDDGATVRLNVDRETTGTTYTLTAAQVEDRTGNVSDAASSLFIGQRDETPPAVTAVMSQPGSLVQVVFGEKVDSASCRDTTHYRIDGLQVIKATPDSDGMTVHLQTSPQTAGVLYSLTVEGIRDEAGNASSAQSFAFAGDPDVTPPQAVKIKVLGGKLQLTFSERLEPAVAADASRYAADGDSSFTIQQAAYEDATGTVTLTTTPLTAGRTYRLDLSHIVDLAGNAVSPAVVSFIGADPITVTDARAITMTTVEVALSRPLRAGESAQLGFKAAFANTVNKLLESAVASLIPTDDPSRLRIKFRLPAAEIAPLFMIGQQYRITMTGPADLVLNDGGNAAVFPGTTAADTQPTITGVTGLPNASLRVSFSEPVKNVSAANFSVKDNSGSFIPVVADLLNDPAKPVSDIVLLLGGALKAGPLYQLIVNSGITDASGWLPLRMPTTRPPYLLPFASIDSPNVPPRMLAASALNRYDVSLSFSEPVSGADIGSYLLTDVTGGQSLVLRRGANADFELKPDRTTMIVHLFQNAGFALQAGHLYTLGYDRSSSAITDLQGMPYDPTDGADSVMFAGNDSELAPLAIEAVRFSTNRMIVTLNRPIALGFGTSSATSMFNVRLDGIGLPPISASIDGREATLSFLQLPSGKSGSVSLSPLWAATYPDPNRIGPDTTTQTFFIP